MGNTSGTCESQIFSQLQCLANCDAIFIHGIGAAQGSGTGYGEHYGKSSHEIARGGNSRLQVEGSGIQHKKGKCEEKTGRC